MPQRFLSIKNFEKYQNFTKKNPPWVKLYKSILGDRDFMRLSITTRFVYIGLIILATESNNKIYNDPTWIGQRLDISPTQLDLKSLYRCGFLVTSNLHRTLSETETETETEKSICMPTHTNGVDHKKAKRSISDEDKPTDKHFSLGKSLNVDVGPEWGKFKNYCLAHDKRYANFEAAFRNWIANAAEYKEKSHAVR